MRPIKVVFKQGKGIQTLKATTIVEALGIAEKALRTANKAEERAEVRLKIDARRLKKAEYREPSIRIIV